MRREVLVKGYIEGEWINDDGSLKPDRDGELCILFDDGRDCAYTQSSDVEIVKPEFKPGQVWEGRDGRRLFIYSAGNSDIFYQVESGIGNNTVENFEKFHGPGTLVLDAKENA